ncbi:uncharacterized protein JCM15063_002546 [Sporobolomyces koalae]|uniref:uncharacterized protein n=1 Tax=Sporobolomyces koalae TaxID=500713 RepID=UPI003178C876
MTEPHPRDAQFAQADYSTVLDTLTHEPTDPPPALDVHTPSDQAVHHAWLKKLVPGIETIAAKYHLGNWVVDRQSGQRRWESMPIYVRIGMQMLYHGKEQTKLVESARVEAMLKAQSIKQGVAYDTPDQALEHIQAFVKTYSINCEELLEPDLTQYPTFNTFFYRKLRPNARPPSNPQDPKIVSSGADCRLTVFETVDSAKEFWIKDRNFTIASLLQDDSLANTFENGSVVIFRLAPADYHRYHSPVTATVESTTHIPGQYYTVNPCAVNEDLPVFTANKRDVTTLSASRGPDSTPIQVAFVQIGAMLVGSIVQTVTQNQTVSRGDELGYFAYGGSTIVMLVPHGSVEWDRDLLDNSKNKLETAIRVGEQIGKFV